MVLCSLHYLLASCTWSDPSSGCMCEPRTRCFRYCVTASCRSDRRSSRVLGKAARALAKQMLSCSTKWAREQLAGVVGAVFDLPCASCELLPGFPEGRLQPPSRNRTCA
jgi:hypothetical protein